ncbi:MAG: NAD(P)/FAD-dependent oxidoreductase [Flavobacterium sp.]|nr:MAG: NAD(P)/FAD-dependent oxidoreductase [Flavobacterium sp.]
MNTNPDIGIVGAGLAGLSAALHLAKAGLKVTVIEKHEFPHHKVCGEYISNEVLPYLEFLGVDVGQLNPTKVTRVSFSTISGREIEGKLPLGGFGISRYAFDNLLYENAVAAGCNFVFDSACDIEHSNDGFRIKTTKSGDILCKIAIGAFGKRSVLDQKLQRGFIRQKSPWLAVKAHYAGSFPDDLVSLHNFHGGYCGVSKVENNTINICYLANYESFRKYTDFDDFQKNVLYENPRLKSVFESSTMIYEKPLAIGQISFSKKFPVENHVLMAGDTAGLIHPLCGNGMAMAMHAAKLASELTIAFFDGKITRGEMEANYAKVWKDTFHRRLTSGRFLSAALQKQMLADILTRGLLLFPATFRGLIRQTHGKPIDLQCS